MSGLHGLEPDCPQCRDHPVVRKVWKIDTPILRLLFHMGFKTEPIHTARLASEESFVINTVVFVGDPTVNREERRKKS